MNAELLQKLSVVTEEEKAILAGKKDVNRALYYAPGKGSNEIDSARVLTDGKLIDIRPNTRFVHFPRHTHNFVEFIYMCSGQTTHFVDGQKIVLHQGDLLFMNQHAVQEILPASRDDIGVNFMILPEFFDRTFQMMGNRESALRDFVISCLTGANQGGNYLYFQVAEVLPVQNLVENLIWLQLGQTGDKRLLSQYTMGLLFLSLMQVTDRIHMSKSSWEQDLVIRLLSYIESRYRTASLADFAKACGVEETCLSRLVRKNTGKTFKELLLEKRISQAKFLLTDTALSVDDIAAAVGYDNTSFFHRLFRARTGQTPRGYRITAKNNDGTLSLGAASPTGGNHDQPAAP